MRESKNNTAFDYKLINMKITFKVTKCDLPRENVH